MLKMLAKLPRTKRNSQSLKRKINRIIKISKTKWSSPLSRITESAKSKIKERVEVDTTNIGNRTTPAGEVEATEEAEVLLNKEDQLDLRRQSQRRTKPSKTTINQTSSVN